MKAAIIDEFGDADVLKITEINKPEINNDEVLIKVKSYKLNCT